MRRLLTIGVTVVTLAGPAFATDTVALSPEEREAAIEAGAARAPINGLNGPGDGRIHGTMGVTVGSNGLRAVEGSAVVPLGENSALGVSFLNVTGGGGRWRGR